MTYVCKKEEGEEVGECVRQLLVLFAGCPDLVLGFHCKVILCNEGGSPASTQL